MTKPKILIVDDEKMTRDAMARLLGHTYNCLTAADGDLALTELERNPDIALIITDYKMPGTNGVELIHKAKEANPSIGAILITAFGEISLAVEAMKNGADDFLTKPITDLEQLEIRVAKAIKTNALEKEVANLKSQLSGKNALDAFTGESPVMQRVYTLIRKVAPTDATVLIEGPSGSGKELAARAVHKLSRRAKGPFIAIECSAFSSDLLKSELFGYEPGTFTGGLKDGKAGCFESAAGGTIFLDEIGEIDAATQIALLRTLETKAVRRLGSSKEIQVDFRLIAATNRDLKKMVAEGKFREDLFYRLNVIGIRMPALHEHREDIAPIVARFLKEYGNDISGIEPKAMKILEEYPWPGNVRELRNIIEKMCVLSGGGKLKFEDVPEEILQTGPINQFHPAQTLEETEKTKILSVLESCGGNKSKAALALGISRRTLHRKINEWRSAGV